MTDVFTIYYFQAIQSLSYFWLVPRGSSLQSGALVSNNLQPPQLDYQEVKYQITLVNFLFF